MDLSTHFVWRHHPIFFFLAGWMGLQGFIWLDPNTHCFCPLHIRERERNSLCQQMFFLNSALCKPYRLGIPQLQEAMLHICESNSSYFQLHALCHHYSIYALIYMALSLLTFSRCFKYLWALEFKVYGLNRFIFHLLQLLLKRLTQ